MAPDRSQSYPPVGQAGGNGAAGLPSQESIDVLTKLLQEFHRRTTPAVEELPPEVKRDVDAVGAIVETLRDALALKPNAPTVTRLSELRGPAGGGTPVTIYGTRFLPGSTVLFGQKPADNFTFVCPTEIRVTTPSGSGKVEVIVNTLVGTARSADGFTYT